MMAHASWVDLRVSAAVHSGDRYFPPTTAPNNPRTPKREAAVTLTFPLLIMRPMTKASGMVHAMVKSPHGLSASALTTTRPSTANRIVIMANKLIIATRPMKGFSSSLSIWPRDFPSLRMEAKRVTASCTPPPRVAPTSSQRVPGR